MGNYAATSAGRVPVAGCVLTAWRPCCWAWRCGWHCACSQGVGHSWAFVRSHADIRVQCVCHSIPHTTSTSILSRTHTNIHKTPFCQASNTLASKSNLSSSCKVVFVLKSGAKAPDQVVKCHHTPSVGVFHNSGERWLDQSVARRREHYYY